ncbi:MAG TPA: cytochrome P450 [Streptosporangiaceae bacterium]|nr:cytochrome P450 [Streptosporangiaceae bacterium]
MTRTHLPDPAFEDIPFYPMTRAASCPLDPPPVLGDLQAKAPFVRIRLWDGSTAWLVTRHAEQRALLADPRVSADPYRPGYPFQSQGLRDITDESLTFLNMDDPEHARLRRTVAGTFTVRRIERSRPAVREIVDDLISDLLAGPRPADLVSRFALPVPSLVICHLLGVPYADHEFLQRVGATVISRETATTAMKDTMAEVSAYLEQMISRKLAAPADDLLSRLASEQIQTGQMTMQELVKLTHLLLLAGHETTANMITLGTLALLRDPTQLTQLRNADDPKLVAAAVEELLRYLSIVHTGLRRLALDDIEIAGQVIRAGEGLVIPIETANRDETVFPRAGMLDIHRDARQHIAFGFGVHQCVGQHLARMELQVSYAALHRRIPTLALAVDPGDLRYKQDGLIYGVHELPVTW